MHALLLRALAEQRGRDVADSHHLGHRDAEHVLNVVADRWDAAARLAGGPARLVDPLDLFRRHAEVASERRRLVDRLLELVFGAEGEVDDVLQSEVLALGSGLAELARVEPRVVHEVAELLLPCRRRARECGLVGFGLDVAVPDGVTVAGVAREPARSVVDHARVEFTDGTSGGSNVVSVWPHPGTSRLPIRIERSRGRHRSDRPVRTLARPRCLA